MKAVLKLIKIKPILLILMVVVSLNPCKYTYAAFGDEVAEFPIPAAKLTLDEARNRMYVSLSPANSVAVIDTMTVSLVTMIPVAPNPQGMAISNDGHILYVTSAATNEITLVDLNNFQAIATIPIPVPSYDIEVGKNEQLFITPAIANHGIILVDGLNGTFIEETYDPAIVSVNGFLEISPDKNSLYFANRQVSPATLSKFDLISLRPRVVWENNPGALGSGGFDLALSKDGNFISYAVYSGNLSEDIFKLNTDDFSVAANFITGLNPTEITYGPFGTFTFTVHAAGFIDVFNANDSSSLPPIQTPGRAIEILTDTGGINIYAAFGDTMRVYSISEGSTPLPIFPDPAMQSCMNALVVQYGWQFAEDVKIFNCSGANVKNIDGLQFLQNLIELDLSHNQIIDAMPLQSHTKLTHLNLTDNRGLNVDDIIPVITNNRELTHLGLGGLALFDLSALPLEDNTVNPPQPYRLLELDLSDNQITDIRRLGNYRLSDYPLKVIDFSGNQIENIDELEFMPQLRQLDVSDNQIVSLFALHNHFGLTHLNLSGNPRVDLAEMYTVLGNNVWLTHLGLGGIAFGGLDNLPLINPVLGQPYTLIELDISNAQLKNIDRLRDFAQLQVVDASDNQIMDLFGLDALYNLRKLDLSNNRIMDLFPLSFQAQLRELNLSGNTNIAPTTIGDVLGNNHELIRLNLAGLPIEDLNVFPPGLNKLLELDISGTKINDISGMEKFPYLRILNLSGNPLDNINALQFLNGLIELDLSNTQIADITALEFLYKLKQLDVSRNQITDVMPLQYHTNLTRLNLTDNFGIDLGTLIPVLKNNTGLTNLGLGGLTLVDLSGLPLEDTTVFPPQPYRLMELDLSNNQITDIGQLGNYPLSAYPLEALNLSGNRIVDLHELEFMPQLRQLDVGDNLIVSLFELRNHHALTHLSLSGNPQVNLEDLYAVIGGNLGLTHLALGGIAFGGLDALPLFNPELNRPYALMELDVSNTGLLGIERLMEFPQLQVLDAGDNQIVDVIALERLLELRHLDLSNNRIFSVSPLLAVSNLQILNLMGNDDIPCMELDNLITVLDNTNIVQPNSCSGVDSDGDGIADSRDNCSAVSNSDQRDTDADGYGNLCDADFDNTGFVNAADLAYLRSKYFSADPNADLNGDGFVNAGDLAILKTMYFGAPGPSGLAP